MDLNIFVKNVYIILLSPAYTNITFCGISHSSHEILTNWLIHVDNFVQRLYLISFIKYIEYTNIYVNIYLYHSSIYFFNKEVGGGGGVVELLLCFWVALPL